MSTSRAHWQRVWTDREPSEVGWFEPVPERSLELIEEAQVGLDAAILDVGGGASTLAGRLLEAGYTEVTVVDVATAALQRAKAELGESAGRIEWVEADIRAGELDRGCDLWHDRALFHFMVEPGDRAGYVASLRRCLRPGGHVIVAGFGPEGPMQCSGLPVVRYGAAELREALGDDFDLLSSSVEEHRTPSGVGQQFLYAHLRRD